MSTTRRTLAILIGVLMFTGLLGGIPTEHTGEQAEAASTTTTYKQRLRAMNVALAQRGDPYQYGAAGPNAFDCSGLTSYSYRMAGRSIPRTTDQQMAGLRGIRQVDKARGDIIIFHRGGDAYHAAIYIGNNQIVHAQQPGTRVHVERIWTSSYVVKRP